MRTVRVPLESKIGLIYVGVLGAVLLNNCGVPSREADMRSFARDGIVFPIQASDWGGMASLTQGTLELEGPCLRIRSEWGSDLVVWPYGFSYRRRGNVIRVYDEDGDVWGSLGNEVILGGGQSEGWDGGLYPGALKREFGRACRGPYWIGSNKD